MAWVQGLMREMTRNMDRAMSNLESMPGGFNALRQVHEQIQVGSLVGGDVPLCGVLAALCQ